MTKLICGDAYKEIKNIPDASVDLIVTDPPYLIESTKTNSNRSNLAKSIQRMNNELERGDFTIGIDDSILEDFVRVLKKINIYIWCNHKQIPQYLNFFVGKYDCKFDIIIWNKINPAPLFNNKYLTDKEFCLYFRRGGYCNPMTYEDAKTVFYQSLNVKDKKKFKHPTIKPLNIIETLIKNSSKEKEIILDPFMGSGTTGEACKLLGRDFIGIELDEKYFKIAEQRINNGFVQKDVTDEKLSSLPLFLE